jgi:hypothetical protein
VGYAAFRLRLQPFEQAGKGIDRRALVAFRQRFRDELSQDNRCGFCLPVSGIVRPTQSDEIGDATLEAVEGMHQPDADRTLLSVAHAGNRDIDDAILESTPDAKNMAEEVDLDIDAANRAPHDSSLEGRVVRIGKENFTAYVHCQAFSSCAVSKIVDILGRERSIGIQLFGRAGIIFRPDVQCLPTDDKSVLVFAEDTDDVDYRFRR